MTTSSVRLRLDTSQAQAELQRLVSTAQGAANQMGSSIRKKAFVGSALGGFAGSAFGRRRGGFGSMMGMGGASMLGSGGDILNASLSQLKNQLDKFLFGDKGPEARAATRAQDDIVKTMAMAAGLSGSVPPVAKDIFDARRQIFEAEEKGAQMIRTSDAFNPMGFSSGADNIGKYIDQAVTTFVTKIFASMSFGQMFK